MSFACSSPAGGMLFGVSGLLLFIIIITIKRCVTWTSYRVSYRMHPGQTSAAGGGHTCNQLHTSWSIHSSHLVIALTHHTRSSVLLITLSPHTCSSHWGLTWNQLHTSRYPGVDLLYFISNPHPAPGHYILGTHGGE